jgi:hypothetical protein
MKKCDFISFFEKQNFRKIFDGCELNEDLNKLFPEEQSTVSIITSKSYCTGTFIGRNTILSAAHCFDLIALNSHALNLDKILIISMNEHHKIQFSSIPEKYKTKINKLVIHPYFLKHCTNNNNHSTSFNYCNFGDLAILKTEKTVARNLDSLNDYFEINARQAKVLTSFKNDNEKLIFVGYGKSFDGENSIFRKKRWGVSYLKQVNKKNFNATIVLSPTGDFMSLLEFYHNYIRFYVTPAYAQEPSSSLLFAKGSENESGVCKGDSGGPLFMQKKGNFAIAGVTCANIGTQRSICGHKESISTNIAAYAHWIEQEVKSPDKWGRTDTFLKID